MALVISRMRRTVRNILILMVIIPSWTSFLIRIYAWMGILGTNGYLNNLLIWLGVIDTPLVLLYTQTAVYIGIVYAYLPFMVFPIYTILVKTDWTLIEAAYDLGARPLTVFFKVLLPLSKQGIIAGFMLVFIPAVGEFVVPDLLGSSNVKMIGNVIWNEFFNNRNWPLASAITVVMLLGTLAGYIIERKKSFRGRNLFSAMITAPLVMPEVITGISLLLLFVGMQALIGFPAGRGLVTIWMAHTTFCSAFVSVIIYSRLRESDKFIEEAALDLGCHPFKIFFTVTMPIILPALISSWLLSFTLSFDDLVISSFVSGPSSTTLPIQVYSSVRLGVKPEINAVATIIVMIVITAAVTYGIISIREENKKLKQKL
ncbi:hypothetical protein CHS0354_013136 [Potamilus streckersoni]|uniref:ABC transmembrane type-1 domain-containing protein n=1 Tax=Potamilus streckersoni TaxID=2493646 RepID=A0AAE0VQF3_9BIVA|nr:hypothetical protein CHS0354_013136 [Potamilus streckersoni]